MSDDARKARARMAATAPQTPREARQAKEAGSGTRQAPPMPLGASVDSLLLDYLNKPTVPGMPAVKSSLLRGEPPIARIAPPIGVVPGSGVPTSPPQDPLPGGEGGAGLTLVDTQVLPYEDERPTGRWDAPAESNPRDLVRDRGVLVRLDGEGSGELLSLPREAVLIGRTTRAHVLLADPSVSREHARIVYQYGAFYVEDLGSQNGTLLAGRRVTRAELRDGDLLQFGQRATFRFGLMDQTQERVMQRLYDSSMRDALTGADNRRHLDGRLIAEIAFANRHARPLSVVLLDIDFFKGINDKYGHQAGDEVLRSVAAIIRGQLRTEDALARYGGEEFAVVLRDTALAEAAFVAERIRERIARSNIEVPGATVAVTVSAGCSSLACCEGKTTEELIGVSDRRLYQAKRTGRNRVIARDDAP